MPAKKNAGKASLTRSTAGAGFDFEDHVAAWLLLKVLTGQPLPGIEGSGTQLQMQVEPLGWVIDDILLTAIVSANDPRRLAISCKSNQQVTASGLPADFVVRCWRQWSKTDDNPMIRHKDKLMLATRGRHNPFMATWTDLKAAARSSDSELALRRMTGTAKHRKVFQSVKDPANDAGVTPSDEDVVEMINNIEIMPLDFQVVGSEYESDAIAKSRSLLVNNSLSEGNGLWQELLSQAKNVRLGSGTVEVLDLWHALRKTYNLKDYPDYESSWKKLRALTEDYRRTIETEFVPGRAVQRETETDQILEMIKNDTLSVVFGESGSGKSALVKEALIDRLPNCDQVWLGPEELELVVDENRRTRDEIEQPVLDVLTATAKTENILVVDSAERLSDGYAIKAKVLIEKLQEYNEVCEAPVWRVIVIGLTEAWHGGALQKLTGGTTVGRQEVEALASDTVKDVLRGTSGLEWLSTHSDAVSALTNLRTLAWVIQAAGNLSSKGGKVSLSLGGIADQLWRHWTDNRTSVQRLLIKLAEREANFEHSFAISEFEAEDAAVLDSLPAACPLRKSGSTGRVRFQHNLAADWVRYQRLREITDNVIEWSNLASNPFWHGALRMLGQFLLRQQVGSRNAWDEALTIAEQQQGTVPLAVDVLLDALFLDPNAGIFLDERADVLLADRGTRFLRLVNRFEHIATVPGHSGQNLGSFSDLGLYIETQFRVPVVTRWPAIAFFLSKYQDRVASLTAPGIARLCDRWLSATPSVLSDGSPMPLRREFAQLALASARELQLGRAKGIIYAGDEDWEVRIYQAALAGAPDLPCEVSEWALEMAQRRPYRDDLQEKIREHHRERAEEHARRMQQDAAYRERHERLKLLPPSLPFRQPLPPWPLGPADRVETEFREAVLRSASFRALMEANAAVAAEVLLACIIEDQPEEEYGSVSELDHQIGIEADHEGYATAPWKSPFLSFLQVNRAAAFECLNKLINFATERWALAAGKKFGTRPKPLSLLLEDGTRAEYSGNYWVFAWSQENSLSLGQLHSALAALEHRFYRQMDAGVDIEPQLRSLLLESKSVAMLGVLVNVAKYNENLLGGPLRPLLQLREIYEWDSRRVNQNRYAFDAMNWVTNGELIFELAKAWVLAPHRERKLRDVVVDVIVKDHDLGDLVVQATRRWSTPTLEKAALESQVLACSLDYRNYTLKTDAESGEECWGLDYPADLKSAVAQFEQDNARLRQALLFPEQAEIVLTHRKSITEAEAASVGAFLSGLEGDHQIDLKEPMILLSRVAAATVLLLRAKEWANRNEEIREKAQMIVDSVLAEVLLEPMNQESERFMPYSYLKFGAYFAVERWIAHSTVENDRRVLVLLTSGDDMAVQVILGTSYRYRKALGQRWWRLVYLALLWSALSMLRGRFGDEEEISGRWKRWCRWFTDRRLSVSADPSAIDPLDVAERLERIKYCRWQRRSGGVGGEFPREPKRALLGGLDTHFLANAFAWLFPGEMDHTIPEEEIEVHTDLVAAFWMYQKWWLCGSAEDERDDYPTMSNFGYSLLGELARLVVTCPADTGPSLWRPVFALGPKGHYTIGHFLSCWFAQLTESTVVTNFLRRWRPMVEFVLLDEQWAESGPWYYAEQLERRVLGFESTAFLKRVAAHGTLVGGMRDLYRVWADKRLHRNEHNLAGFCAFLANEVGRPLRLDGLRWMASALKNNPECGNWYRHSTSSAFVECLDVLVLEHADELRRDNSAREALLELSTHAASRQFTAALQLQERIRGLFREEPR